MMLLPLYESKSPYPKYTQEEIIEYVEPYQDQFYAGDAGYTDLSKLEWKFENVDLSTLLSVKGDEDDWIEWYDGERSDDTKDMEDKAIEKPVVIYDNGNSMFVYDGYHRIGASYFKNRKTVPAFVGTK